MEAETERTLRNLGAVLDAAGVGFADVVKTTVFLVDMADFAAMNAVYADVLSRSAAGAHHRPGRGAPEGLQGRDRGHRAAAEGTALDGRSRTPIPSGDQPMTPLTRPSGSDCCVGDDRPARPRRRA